MKAMNIILSKFMKLDSSHLQTMNHSGTWYKRNIFYKQFQGLNKQNHNFDLKIRHRYELNSDKYFHGVTYLVFDGYERFFLMLGANKSIFWVSLLPEEYGNVTSFSKPVRTGAFCRLSLLQKSFYDFYHSSRAKR